MLLIRLVRLYRRIREHKAIGAGVVLSLAAIAVLGNSVCFYLFDGPSRDIHFGDALWYSMASITTIGYGDIAAQSWGARLGTFVFIVLLGLSTFSVFLGMTIEWATDWAMKGRRGMNKILAKNHVLIVNFPSTDRVRQVLHELRADPEHREAEIVIITDQIETLPFEEPGLLFVRGSILERDTYHRARIEDAKMAIVLATSYSDFSSDAVVASAIAVMDSIKPELYVIAECLNHKHRLLFNSVRCDAIVFSFQISGNLLAQEAHDPGVSQLVDMITSNTRGTTLYSTPVFDVDFESDYAALVHNLLDHDINVLCVNRGDETLTSFRSLQPQPGDRLIYSAANRYSWSAILEKIVPGSTMEEVER